MKSQQAKAQDLDRYLNFREAQEYLGKVATSTLREWTKHSHITSYKRGKRRYYRLSALDNFMARGLCESIYELAEKA